MPMNSLPLSRHEAPHAWECPTLTILALAWRACDYAMAEMKKGNIG